MKGTVVLLAALVAVATASNGEYLENGCPADFSRPQLLPSSASCNEYFVCSWGQLIPRNCPEGLHFSSWTQSCVFPVNSSCRDPESESVPEPAPAPEPEADGEAETEVKPESEYLENGCPADFSRPLLLPSSASCNEYFVCSWGQLIPRNCPEGQHFSSWVQSCVVPVNSQCRNSNTQRSEVKSIIIGEQRDYLENGCPADFSRPLLLPSSASCNEYFVCSWGQLIPRNCPEGLHFSSWTQSCVFPVNSSCRDPESESVPEPAPAPEPEADGEAETEVKPESEYLENGCPADFSRPLLLPSSASCNEYFVCSWGQLIPRNCPEGQHFSSWVQSCVVPVNSQCRDSNTQRSEIKSISGEQRDYLENGCPADFSRPLLLPSSASCNEYFVCSWGQLIPRNCPEGQHFSSWVQSCVLPVNSQCRDSNTQRSEVKSIIIGEQRDYLENGCPADFSRPLLLPSSASCNEYFVCSWGQLIPRNCPEGQHFSSWVQSCVLPVNSQCRDSDTQRSEVKLVSGEQREFLENGCPADFSRPQLLPSSASCNEYFMCSWGQLIPRNCPAGLHFSPWVQSCVQPIFSECTVSTNAQRSEVKLVSGEQRDYLANGCPADFSRPMLLPSTTSCNEYFMCSWGQLVSRNCPAGLHFSPWVQSCVQPINSLIARCKPTSN